MTTTETPVRITLDAEGSTVTLTLTGYLGGAKFGGYRDAVAGCGARYVPAERCNRAPVEAVPQLLRALDVAGLGVSTDEALVARLREKADDARQLLDEGRARLAAVDAALADRGLKLFGFQRSGVEWLAPRDRALLCDEMGLGKTVQALVALPAGAATLVVAPAAAASVWVAECRRWRPDLAPVVIKGRDGFRWPRAGELVVASYGILPADAAAVGTPEVGTTIVADEAHNIKNSKAKRTVAFRALVSLVRTYRGRTWLVTGTPLLNRPPELWSLLQTAGLAQDAFGSWSDFCRMLGGSKGRYGYAWGRPSDEVPDRLRRVSLHRRRAEVLPQLPAKTRQDVEVNGLSRETIRACDEALAALGLGADDVPELHPGMPAFEQVSRARALLAAAKIPHVLEQVEEHEEAGEPLVVFSWHKAPVEALRGREGWAVVTGETPAGERGAAVERFQRGELRGIAGTIGALGVSVTLTRAHRLLMVDLPWTPALCSQAEDRVCRIGQDRGVVVVRLVAAHDIDRRVVELLTAKQELIEATVEASAVPEGYIGTAVADELTAAADAVARTAADQEEQDLRRQAERAVRMDAAKAEARERFGRDVEVSEDGKRRAPATPAEEHAARALAQLSASDPDRAAEENGVGFSKQDGEFGHSLAAQVARSGMLSERQWACAVRLAQKYRRQVGTP